MYRVAILVIVPPLLFVGAASTQARVDDMARGVAMGVTRPDGGDCDKDETVDVGGHASNEELDEYKQTLSERRARSTTASPTEVRTEGQQ